MPDQLEQLRAAAEVSAFLASLSTKELEAVERALALMLGIRA
jgi:hypothetical protein